MFQELGRPEKETTPVKLLWHDRSIPDGLSGRRDRLYIGIDEMKEGVALPQLFSARFGAQVAICAIGPIAFETCAKVERADGIASMTIGARFPGIGNPGTCGPLAASFDESCRCSSGARKSSPKCEGHGTPGTPPSRFEASRSRRTHDREGCGRRYRGDCGR